MRAAAEGGAWLSPAVASQVVRRALEETPYACGRGGWEQRREGLTYIRANIVAERNSQKDTVIGAGGNTLKRIGRAARREIEPMVGHRVYLDL